MENVYCKGSEVMQQKTDFITLHYITLHYDLEDTEVDFPWTQRQDEAESNKFQLSKLQLYILCMKVELRA